MDKIIIYDFDGTLTPYPLPKYKVLEECGFSDGMMNDKFMNLVKDKSKSENKDLYDALIEVYFDILKANGIKLDDNSMCVKYDEVIYNNGVEDFLKMLYSNGIKNYLLSSGFKNYLEKISISRYFEDIYGTTFNYDNEGIVVSVNFIMKDINKVYAIKGILCSNGMTDCSNVIYVGDGLTDCFAMDYVIKNGGTTIFVYQNDNQNEIEIMKEKGIVTFYCKADYSAKSELRSYVKKLFKI